MRNLVLNLYSNHSQSCIHNHKSLVRFKAVGTKIIIPPAGTLLCCIVRDVVEILQSRVPLRLVLDCGFGLTAAPGVLHDLYMMYGFYFALFLLEINTGLLVNHVTLKKRRWTERALRGEGTVQWKLLENVAVYMDRRPFLCFM